MNENIIVILIEIVLAIITTIILGVLAFVVLYIMNKPPPDRTKNFCQAQYEVYNKPIEECMDSYKNKIQ